VIEGDLEKLHLVASADSARERILSAARSARKDQLVGRWIGRGATGSILVAIVMASLGDQGPRMNQPDRDPIQLLELAQGGAVVPDLSDALIPLPRSVENPPWMP
jgi:hypothetical protein